MNIEEGLRRIYIICSILWAAFWIMIGFSDKEIASPLFGIITPFILYCIICWIIKGFKADKK